MDRLTRLVSCVAVCVYMLLGVVSGVYAQGRPTELSVAVWLPPTHPFVKELEETWAPSLNDASSGTLQLKVYPASQLGNAFDHYDMARDGIADIALVVPGFQPGRFPIIAAPELPFAMTGAVSDTSAVDLWYRKYAPSEMRDVRLCLTMMSAPNRLHTSVKKITLPEDLKGMKLRPSNASVAAMNKMFGGVNVQATPSEARDLLSRGVADGLTFPWNSVALFKLDNALKYHATAAISSSPMVLVINKQRYESLTLDQQNAIDSHCTSNWATKLISSTLEYEDEGLLKIESLSGHEIYDFSEEELAVWVSQTAPMLDEWKSSVEAAGENADNIYADLLSHLKAAFQ